MHGKRVKELKSERVKGKILIVVAAMLLAGCAGQRPDRDVRNDREMVAEKETNRKENIRN